MQASPPKWRSALKKAFGLKADTTLRMQTAYYLAQVRAREREIVVDWVAG